MKLSYFGLLPLTTLVSAYHASEAGTKRGCYWKVPDVGSFNTHYAQDWSKSSKIAARTVAVSAVKLDFSPSNVRYNKSEGAVALKVTKGQEKDVISGAMLNTPYDDILYGTVRTVAKISNIPGLSHGFSFYSGGERRIDFGFKTGSDPKIYLTSSSSDFDSAVSSYSVAAPSDAETKYREYRVDWLAGVTKFFIDDVLVHQFKTNIPSQPGFWMWTNLPNGNQFQQGGSQSSALKIRSIDAYFNRVSVAREIKKNPSRCAVKSSTSSGKSAMRSSTIINDVTSTASTSHTITISHMSYAATSMTSSHTFTTLSISRNSTSLSATYAPTPSDINKADSHSRHTKHASTSSLAKPTSSTRSAKHTSSPASRKYKPTTTRRRHSHTARSSKHAPTTTSSKHTSTHSTHSTSAHSTHSTSTHSTRVTSTHSTRPTYTSLATQTSQTPHLTHTTRSTSSETADAAGATPTVALYSNSTVHILKVFYADSDVTEKATHSFSSGKVDTHNLHARVGGSPYVNYKNSLTVFYKLNNDWRILSVAENSGVYNLRSDIASTHLPTNIKASAGANVKLLALTWGPQQITSQKVFSKVYADAAKGEGVTLSNPFFGKDTWPGELKTGTIWYQTRSGAIVGLAGKEGQSLEL